MLDAAFGAMFGGVELGSWGAGMSRVGKRSRSK